MPAAPQPCRPAVTAPLPEPQGDRTTGTLRPGHRSVRPVHASNGRLRLHVPRLYGSERLRHLLEAHLRHAPGVEDVSASALTGRLLVILRPGQPHATIIREVERLLGIGPEASPAPPALRTTPVPAIRAPGHRSPVAARAPDDTAWHATDLGALLTRLGTSRTAGLSAPEAAARLAQLGPNALARGASRSDLAILTGQFASLPVALLGASAVLSLATGGIADAVAILGVLAINAGIGFYTERQAERTITALTAPGPRTATVVRDAAPVQVPFHEVVVGDLLALSAGQYVAADVRLVESERLSIDESALTGESVPAAKDPSVLAGRAVALADRINMAYRETLVTGGSGLGVVVATGAATEIGRIQTLVGTARPPETPMQRQLGQLGRQLVLLSGAVCGLVLVAGVARGYGWLRMLRTAASLAVAAVPEGLPTVATTTLALGIRRMRGQHVIVRRLEAVETLGAARVICLDKTGTLTRNRMAVIAVHASGQRLQWHGGLFHPSAGLPVAATRADLRRLLEVACLCNDSAIEGAPGAEKIDGSPTENALVQAALAAGVDVRRLRHGWPRMLAHYRAEGRNYMVTLHRGDGTRLLAVKGSPAEVLGLCTYRLQEAGVVPLSEDDRAAILQENDLMGGEALRVLGFAYLEAPDIADLDSPRLVWAGLAGLADPVREGVRDLIALLHRAGIRTVMITGDQSGTAYAIGRQLGLSGTDHLEILDAGNLERVDPAVLAALADKVHVFSRVSPAHKLAIVQALQRAGHVVAMTGDGINDGPALKAADVGIAMGASGTQVARDVAGMVIEDDELRTLTTAIREGRTIYGNIRKSVHYLASTNLSEIAITLAGVAGGVGEPLNTMQLLWLNLLTDVLPALALAVEPPEPQVLDRAPRDPRLPILGRDQFLRYGLESAALTAGTLVAYCYGIARYGAGPRAGTLAFGTLTLGQLMHAYSCRSEERSVFDPGALPRNRWMDRAVAGSILLQLAAMYAPGLRGLLRSTPLGIADLAVAVGAAVAPFLFNEFTKGAPRQRPAGTGKATR